MPPPFFRNRLCGFALVAEGTVTAAVSAAAVVAAALLSCIYIARFCWAQAYEQSPLTRVRDNDWVLGACVKG